MKTFLFLLIIWPSISFAQAPPPTEIKPSQVSFDYLSSDGGFWIDCDHTKEPQQHAWSVICGSVDFSLHLFLREFLRPLETTFEFHYWATSHSLKQSSTQSMWLTVDRDTKAKKLVGYLGFLDDSTQLRIEIDFTK